MTSPILSCLANLLRESGYTVTAPDAPEAAVETHPHPDAPGRCEDDPADQLAGLAPDSACAMPEPLFIGGEAAAHVDVTAGRTTFLAEERLLTSDGEEEAGDRASAYDFTSDVPRAPSIHSGFGGPGTGFGSGFGSGTGFGSGFSSDAGGRIGKSFGFGGDGAAYGKGSYYCGVPYKGRGSRGKGRGPCGRRCTRCGWLN
jgi:hypothetical protein